MHDKPKAEIEPNTSEPAPVLFGYMAGTVLQENDIVAPTGEVWSAEQD